MNWLKFAILAALVTVLQTSFVPVVFPDVFRPNLLVVMAVYYLLTVPHRYTMIAVLILGILADLTSASPLGSLTLGFAVIALVLRAIRPILFTEFPTAHAFAAFAAFILLVLVYRIAGTYLAGGFALPYGAFATCLQAGATGLISALLCRLFVRRIRPAW